MAQAEISGSIYSRSGKLLHRKYREFFLPTVLASITSSMALIVDSIIVGNMLGPAEMASVNLCLPIMQAFMTLAILLGMGTSTLISIHLGRRDTTSANTVFTIAILLSVICGILLTAVSVPFSGPLSRILTSDETLLPLVSSYLHTMLWGSAFMLTVPIFSYILRTDGMVRLASMLLIVTNLTNLILDVIFIGPCGMGIAGSALATVCGFMAGIGMLIIYRFSKHRSLQFVPLHKISLRENLSRVRQVIKAGSPGAISSGLIAVKIFCINLLVGHVAGSTGLVVFSVCISCLSFVSMFISGTAGTMMPIIGTLYGEHDLRGIRLIFRYTLRFALMLTGGIVLLFECFPSRVFALFGVIDPAILNIGIPSLRLFSISLVGVAVSFLLIYYYMTTQRQVLANTLSLLEGIVILIPAAWLLSSVMGITGVWVAFIFAEIGALTIIYILSRRKMKQSDGKYEDMLLIEHSDPELLYDVSLSATPQDAARLSNQAIQVLVENGLEERSAMKAGIALEEMVVNASTYLPNRKRHIDLDIRISWVRDDLLIALRDNGVYFNPTEYQPNEKEFTVDGIVLLRTIASEITYSRVLGLNQTLITIAK